MTSSAGVTLIELLVVLTLVGVMLSLTPPAFPLPDSDGVDQAAQLAAARLTAAREARAVALTDVYGRALLFLPDGSVLGQGIDLLTGEPSRHAR